MYRLNLNFKFLDEILVGHMGGQSSFAMCRLNLNFKILGEKPGGSIIFHHVQAKSELKNFRWDTGWSYCRCQSSFTICRLNLNFKILTSISPWSWDSACTWWKMIDPPLWLTSISPKILKFRFSLHMVKYDWPPKYDWPVSHLKF